MKTTTAAISLAAGLLAAPLSAKVSFSLDIEALLEGGSGTTALSNSGLLVLVVDTGGDGFSNPTAGSYVGGNDEVVATWDLSEHHFTSGDLTLLSDSGITYESSWSEGDDLALYWYPSLSASEAPAADTPFGVFADSFGLASGDPWQLPQDGTLLHSLKLFTAAASKLVAFGDFPIGAGFTAFAVNNPPSASPTPDLEIANAGGKSTLTWSVSANPAAGYVVQRRTNGGTWETIGFAGSDATSFADEEVKPGREYEYRVYSQSGTMVAQSDLPPAIESERSVFGNVSARSRIVAGDPRTQMFGGVIAEGNDPTKNVVLQAIGRSFFAQDNFVADPALTVYRGTEVIAENDDWIESQNALALDGSMAIGNAVELAEESKDASELIEATMDVGHTFAVSSVGGDTGDVLLGIFNGDSAELGMHDNRIVNLSARGYLDGDDPNSVFAGGTIIRGNVPKEVLVMAWGPYLAGISPDLEGETIENPSLKLRRLEDANTIIASNDDWETQTASTSTVATVETDVNRIRDVVTALGYQLYDDGSTDALLLVTLQPGAYTFEIDGGDGSGIGLFAIDEVEID